MASSKYLLFLACETNNLNLIKECIKNGYNVNERNINGQTPLMVFLKSTGSCKDATLLLTYVKLFVDHGAILNTIDYDGKTAIALYLTNSYNQDIKTYLKDQSLEERRNNNNFCFVDELKWEIKKNQSPTITTKKVINRFDGEGFTLFMWSIWYSNINHFNYYIGAGADINLKNPDGKTPLMLACYKYNFDIIKQLLAKGALVNELDNFGNSALTYVLRNSVFSNLHEIIQQLLEAGADINLCGEHGKTPLIWSAIHFVRSYDEKKFEKFLSKININDCDNEGNTALGYLAYHGMVSMVPILFMIYKSVKIDHCGKNGRTPLAWAITGNHIDMVKYLVDEKDANIHHIDFQEHTALSYARRYERFDMINYLVHNGAIDFHQHPLIIAMRSNQFGNVRAILKDHWNHNITQLNKTPLCLAIRENNLDFVKFFIKNGADCSQKDQKGNTPLIAAIMHSAKNTEIIEHLLENGAKLTIHSAFSAALETENVEIIKLLIENGGKVNKIYKDKGSPLSYAIETKNQEICKLLLEFGASPNIDNKDSDEKPSLLQSACKLQLFDIIKLLVAKGTSSTNCSDSNKFPSPLRTVILLNDYTISKYLIENGANVCEIFKDEKSLLQLAVENRNVKLVKILVEKDLEVLKIRNQHVSPLRRAIELNDNLVSVYLIQQGANVNEIDENSKRNLLELTIKNKNISLVVALIQNGANIATNRAKIEEYAKEDPDFDEFFNDYLKETAGI